MLSDLTEPELRDVMKAAADAVKGALPTGTLFVVLAFDDPGLAQYISNCSRENMVAGLREAANRLERRENVPR